MQRQRSGGYWLLKGPAHVISMDALLGVYPDAHIVRVHRDLREVIPSTCSLLATLHHVFSEQVDDHVLARRVVERSSRIHNRLAAAEPAIQPAQVTDVRYPDLVRDPVGVIRSVLGRIHRPLRPETVARLERWLEVNPRGKHGPHHYDLARFGLDLDEINALDCDHRCLFGLPPW